MASWIFQGNPDVFKIDEYLKGKSCIRWSIKQEHLASEMHYGDEVFIWRAAGKSKQEAGIVAVGRLVGSPAIMPPDLSSEGLWSKPSETAEALRVDIELERVATTKKEVVQRKWLIADPQVSDLSILKMASATNFKITAVQASRIRQLFQNTGRTWDYDENLAGLWAYSQTLDGSVSRSPGSPVAEVSGKIGRAVTGVYNKVMNFRAIDPTDPRAGLKASGENPKKVWSDYFDSSHGILDIERIDRDYRSTWGKRAEIFVPQPPKYSVWGEAPDDNEVAIQEFAKRVRKGQPKFRKNLLVAYDGMCAVSGTGPEEVLEAVHILSHAGYGINKIENGILMRSDLHSLFDAALLKISPETMEIEINDSLSGTDYWQYHGARLRMRVDGGFPNRDYLSEKYSGQSS